MYDYVIVGSGLFGSVFAREALQRGKKCLVVERRDHIGGNLYTEEIEGINVHVYGAHIFHSDSKSAWEYLNQFAEFNNFVNSPLAFYQGELYNLPFNMNTFHQMWGVITPQEALDMINSQRGIEKHGNLEEHAISLVGTDIYTKLIKGYTEKQWGRKCCELPANIMRRIPVRYTYDNNYYNIRYQGVPNGGYTRIIEKMLDGADVILGEDFLDKREKYMEMGKRVLFTGTIDSYYDYCLGCLEYRGLRFETEVLDEENHQGNAVINYTEASVPYTRIMEHKHFEFGTQKKTVISREYPQKWSVGLEPYYPINDEKNNALYQKYLKLAEKENKVIFGGRLGSYAYYDMGDTIDAALDLVKKEFNN